MKEKRILKLHHPTGHPYWQRNKFSVELPNGDFPDIFKFGKYKGEYGEEVEVYSEPNGIYVQYFMCSSGGGKTPYGEKHQLVSKALYDKVEYVGTKLKISKTLKKDLLENQIEL